VPGRIFCGSGISGTPFNSAAIKISYTGYLEAVGDSC
jgi:hypothetical protein